MSGLIDDALLQEVRDRNNIVSVVGDYVSLRKAGNHHKGLCPFHGEKTPSFTVREDRQFFYCFGCQTGGDVITFVREMNGYSFVEAVRHLADRAGLRLPEPSRQRWDAGSPAGRRDDRPGGGSARKTRDIYYAIGRAAQRCFTESLHAMEGQGCRLYLKDRGLESDAVERFGLGYAADAWDRMVTYLGRQGVDLALACEAGLVARRTSGTGHYDRFRHRLTFPIRNLAGEVIAFGGRALSGDPETPKYINSPETPVFTKGATLYGLYEARKAMRKAGRAILVEGNVDVVRLSQAGLVEVVAPMGTALTEDQCRLLRRFVPRVVLLHDGDAAGRAASLKAVPIALGEGLQVSVAHLPDGEDPDSLVGSQGADALREVLAQAAPGFTHLVEQTVGETRADEDARGKLLAIDRLAPVFASLGDQRERDLCRRELAERLDLTEAQVVDYMGAGGRGRRPGPDSAPAAARAATMAAPLPEREMKLLRLLVEAPELSALFLAEDVGALLGHGGIRVAADELCRSLEDEEPVAPGTFAASVADPGLRAALFRSLLDDPPETGDPQERRVAFRQLVTRLRVDDVERRLAGVRRELQRGAGRTDEGAELTLMGALAELSAERNRLQQEYEDLRSSRG